MKTMIRLLFLSVFAASALHAQEALVAAPAKRQLSIDQVQKRISATPVPVEPSVKNPFSMSGFEAAVAVKVEDPKSKEPPTGKDLLATLAEKIDARARVVISGEPMLLTGKQRLQAGSKVPVVHEGLIFELEIVSIETARFTVRYKTEEFTRPITLKPSGK
jgi:glucose/arabinose dehydrogenase